MTPELSDALVWLVNTVTVLIAVGAVFLFMRM